MEGIIMWFNKHKHYGVVQNELDHTQWLFYQDDVEAGYIPKPNDKVTFEIRNTRFKSLACDIEKVIRK